jgi:tripeptide aminopeptidase
MTLRPSTQLSPALPAVLIVVMPLAFTHGVTERFLRYVVIDTQSDPASPTCPSTEKQKDLGKLLASELQAMGLADAHLDAHGYVYATIPANTDKQVPVICFCSHMDTSPDCTGKDVKPQIVKNYRGGDIVLPADPTQVIRAAEHPALNDQIGHDIITTDGTTLLGADNKAGLAEIMDAAQFLLNNPQIRHGAIKILFTPDEEIGRGVDKADLKKLGADFAYTMDGETAGNIEDETFSADGATITIEGVSTHPGFAKGKMEHAIKIAAAIVERLPKDACSPETTEGRQGFLHPIGISGALEQATIDFIVRDFTDEGLKEKEALLESIVKDVMKGFPRSTWRLEIKQQYRNMKQVIDRHPEIINNAMEAIRRTGLTPVKTSIRGGTDGSRLSFMGLPCPNIFAGEHAFHSRLEWVSVQDMEKAVQTIVHLAMIFEERA